MNPSRVATLIAAYGADAARWPDDERDAALACLAADSRLTEQLLIAQRLDQHLDADIARPTADVESLLDRLSALECRSDTPSPSWVDRLVDWLFPDSVGALWQPALAAAVPVVLGVYLGVSGVVLPAEADWSISEQYLFAAYSFDSVDGEVER